MLLSLLLASTLFLTSSGVIVNLDLVERISIEDRDTHYQINLHIRDDYYLHDVKSSEDIKEFLESHYQLSNFPDLERSIIWP